MTNYNEAVTEARRLVKRSEEDQWRLAELTWEQVEAGKSYREWARDIGVHHTTAIRWYKVWAKWGGARGHHSFAETYAMVQQDVDDPIEARQKNEQTRAIGTVRSLPPERKAEVARELLAEPEIAEAVADVIEEQVSDSPSATARVNQKAEAKRPAPSRHEPKRSALSAAASLTAFAAWVAAGEQVVSEVVADVMDGQADPALLTEPNRNLAVLLARLQSAADTGRTFDDALVDLLNGDN